MVDGVVEKFIGGDVITGEVVFYDRIAGVGLGLYQFLGLE